MWDIHVWQLPLVILIHTEQRPMDQTIYAARDSATEIFNFIWIFWLILPFILRPVLFLMYLSFY